MSYAFHSRLRRIARSPGTLRGVKCHDFLLHVAPALPHFVRRFLREEAMPALCGRAASMESLPHRHFFHAIGRGKKRGKKREKRGKKKKKGREKKEKREGKLYSSGFFMDNSLVMGLRVSRTQRTKNTQTAANTMASLSPPLLPSPWRIHQKGYSSLYTLFHMDK